MQTDKLESTLINIGFDSPSLLPPLFIIPPILTFLSAKKSGLLWIFLTLLFVIDC